MSTPTRSAAFIVTNLALHPTQEPATIRKSPLDYYTSTAAPGPSPVVLIRPAATVATAKASAVAMTWIVDPKTGMPFQVPAAGADAYQAALNAAYLASGNHTDTPAGQTAANTQNPMDAPGVWNGTVLSDAVNAAGGSPYSFDLPATPAAAVDSITGTISAHPWITAGIVAAVAYYFANKEGA